MLLLNPRRTRTNMKLLQLVWIFLLTLCGQSGITAMTVKEGGEVILNCSFGRNIENGAFDWKKDVDKSNEDVFWYSGGTTDPGKEFTGAAPEPSVTIFEDTQNSALLQCVVRGAFPKPEVVWTDGAGNIIDADKPKITKTKGSKVDTVLNIIVTKTDNYTCVATQKEIYSQINRTIFVRSNGGASKPDAKEITETKDGVLLQCIVQDPSPQTKVFWKDSTGQDVPSKEQKTENSIILQTTVRKTDDYRCVTTEGKKDDEVYSEIRVKVLDGTSWGLIVGVGIASFILGTIVVGAAVWLWKKNKSAGGSTTDRSIGKNESQAPLKQDV